MIPLPLDLAIGLKETYVAMVLGNRPPMTRITTITQFMM